VPALAALPVRHRPALEAGFVFLGLAISLRHERVMLGCGRARRDLSIRVHGFRYGWRQFALSRQWVAQDFRGRVTSYLYIDRRRPLRSQGYFDRGAN
jgi:hypothetical protein